MRDTPEAAVIIPISQASDETDFLNLKLCPAAAIARMAASCAGRNDPDLSDALQAVAVLIDDARDHIEALLVGTRPAPAAGEVANV